MTEPIIPVAAVPTRKKKTRRFKRHNISNTIQCFRVVGYPDATKSFLFGVPTKVGVNKSLLAVAVEAIRVLIGKEYATRPNAARFFIKSQNWDGNIHLAINAEALLRVNAEGREVTPPVEGKNPYVFAVDYSMATFNDSALTKASREGIKAQIAAIKLNFLLANKQDMVNKVGMLSVRPCNAPTT